MQNLGRKTTGSCRPSCPQTGSTRQDKLTGAQARWEAQRELQQGGTQVLPTSPSGVLLGGRGQLGLGEGLWTRGGGAR